MDLNTLATLSGNPGNYRETAAHEFPAGRGW
jgi:hypothetical protein